MRYFPRKLNALILLSLLLLVGCGGGGDGGGSSSEANTFKIISTSPNNNDSNVLTNIQLSFTFNNDVDLSTLNNSSFTLTGSNPITGTIIYDSFSKTAIFAPDSDLEPSTDHTATLTTSITDTAGNALAKVYTLNFKTKQIIQRVSVSSSGTEGNNISYQPSISSNGRYVAFGSEASNLISNDTNNASDIFRHDTQTGNTIRVNVNSAGQQSNAFSSSSRISADGRYISFYSTSSNLVANDTNSNSDIFRHDTQTGETIRVNLNSVGLQANGNSLESDMSGDGRYVAFISNATNLVNSDLNGLRDVFRHDIQTGNTILVSKSTNGIQANDYPTGLSISADGRYVAFISEATNLVSNDTNNTFDVFKHDAQTGITTRVNVSSVGQQANAESLLYTDISENGRYIIFNSYATNLVSGDTNSNLDIFRHDSQTGETIRVNLNSGGQQASSSSNGIPTVSADGRYVVFRSSAANLVSNDTNVNGDIFKHDTQTGETIRINLNSDNQQANDDSLQSAISADGRYVVFNSKATNLAVNGDTNASNDIFLVLTPNP